MRRTWMTTVIVAAGIVAPFWARAQSPDAIAVCAKITDEKSRLICFDAVAKVQSDQKSAADGPSASTKTADLITPSAPQDYKVVSGADLFVSPGKFQGRPIELRRVRCFHADRNEYRCIDTVNTVVIFSSKVEPAQGCSVL